VRAKSYEDWRELGYQVRKGERATGTCPKTGKRTFTRAQVDESEHYDDLDDDAYSDHPGNPANFGDN
jgi:hypothetical protein